MTWFKVDDTFHAHEKVMELSTGPCFSEAIALWLLAGNWSAHAEKEGHVPRGVAANFSRHPEAASELVRVGLWETTERGYVFHDWADYQPSGEAIEERRRKGAERKAKSRERLSKAKLDHALSSDVGASRRDCVSVTGDVTGVPRTGLTGSGSGDLNSSSQISDQEEKSFQDTAHEDTVWRTPLPEVPPQVAPQATSREARKRALAVRICDYVRGNAKQRFKKRATPSMAEAEVIAAWCMEPDLLADWNLSDEAMTKRVCDAYLADDWAREHAFPLSALRKNPGRYLGDHPSAPKPQATGGAAPNTWTPPAWMTRLVPKPETQAEINATIAAELSEDDTIAAARAALAGLRKTRPQSDAQAVAS